MFFNQKSGIKRQYKTQAQYRRFEVIFHGSKRMFCEGNSQKHGSFPVWLHRPSYRMFSSSNFSAADSYLFAHT